MNKLLDRILVISSLAITVYTLVAVNSAMPQVNQKSISYALNTNQITQVMVRASK